MQPQSWSGPCSKAKRLNMQDWLPHTGRTDWLRRHQFWGDFGFPRGPVPVAIVTVEPATAHTMVA
jgi:hypothetical protein